MSAQLETLGSLKLLRVTAHWGEVCEFRLWNFLVRSDTQLEIGLFGGFVCLFVWDLCLAVLRVPS